MADVKLQKLRKYLDNSPRILITSHLSPDPDAFCSILMVLQTLKATYPRKSFLAVLEDYIPANLEFLAGSGEVVHQNMVKSIMEFKPDAVITVDAYGISRCTRTEPDKLKALKEETGFVLLAFDHHRESEPELGEFKMNDKDVSSCCELLYWVLIDGLRLKEFEGMGDILMTGIIFDTGRFLYPLAKPDKTLELVARLLKRGVVIELLYDKINVMRSCQLKVVSCLLANTSFGKDYMYSWLDGDFYENYVKEGGGREDFKVAVRLYMSHYLRVVDGRRWGFVVCPEVFDGTWKGYQVNFRAALGSVDVSVFAKELGGGGHRAAAGAKLSSSGVKVAISEVIKVIEMKRSQAEKTKDELR